MLPIGTNFPVTDTSTPVPKPRASEDKVVNHTNISSSVSDSDSEYSFADCPVIRRNSSVDSSSQHDDDHGLIGDASDAGSEEDALNQDLPEDHPEDVDDEPSTVDVDSSIADDETSTADDDPSIDDEETTETPVPAPRRSGRDKSAPKWTKDYIMMAQSQQDWLQRATFLKEMLKDGYLQNLDSSVCQMTLLNIISTH